MTIWDDAMQLVENLQADCVLVLNRANIRYLSGYTNDTGCLLITKKERYLLTDFRFLYQAKQEAVECKVIKVESTYEALVETLLQEAGAKCLAFEMEDVTYATYCRYEKAISIPMLPIANVLSTLRRVKSATELSFLREAEKIGDRAFEAILPELKPGVTESYIAAKLEFLMRSYGADGISFPAIVASGVNSSMPHAIPSEKKLAQGDFVTMDFGCTYHGYCSDMTRTVVLGKATEKQKEIYGIVLDAQLACLREVKAGMTGQELDSIARKIITDAGYGHCFGHSLGHSVGLEIHEKPTAGPKSTEVLEKDMLITVEPGIYVEGFGGVRIEDLVIVGENGCENLAFSKKMLMEL